ncbi:MAG: caspase family protein [Armatimonadetes bacterium]|nr:caspase family protein [Armatimonadota bacterium]
MIYVRAFGIEKYHDASLSTVDFAENDATDFASAWANMGHEVDARVLLSDVTTLTRIRVELDDLVGRVGERDVVVLYYAGHGFRVKDRNRLSAIDTYLERLDDSTIELEDIFRRITSLRAQKAMLFVDACHSGLELLSSTRSPTGTFSAEELRMYDRDARAVVIFASCSSDERSFPYVAARHGYWTSCLLEAISGDIPAILRENELLYAQDLQEYLAIRVPEVIRDTRRGTATQLPRAFMDFNKDFIVADLGNIIRARAVGPTGVERIADHVELRGITTGSVKSLSGFLKGKHKVFPSVTPASQAFVVGIASEDMNNLFDQIYPGLHTNLKYLYSELKANRSGDGFSIITPGFDVYASIAQSEDDSSEYKIEITTDSFRQPETVQSPGFLALFEGYLDTIVVHLPTKHDLNTTLKRLEASPLRDTVRHNHGLDISFELVDLGLEVILTSETLEFRSARGPYLKRLISNVPNALASLQSSHTGISLPLSG